MDTFPSDLYSNSSGPLFKKGLGLAVIDTFRLVTTMGLQVPFRMATLYPYSPNDMTPSLLRRFFEGVSHMSMLANERRPSHGCPPCQDRNATDRRSIANLLEGFTLRAKSAIPINFAQLGSWSRPQTQTAEELEKVETERKKNLSNNPQPNGNPSNPPTPPVSNPNTNAA